VLDDVGAQHHVIAVAHLGGDAAVEVGHHEAVDPVDHARQLHVVHAHHPVAGGPQLLGQAARRAAQVEDRPRFLVPETGQDPPVGTRVVGLEPVLVARGGDAPRPEAGLLEPVPGHVHHHVAGVPQAVHVADLVAVVGGDRDLDDPLPGVVQLDDDLGVEVEVVGVAVERDGAQCGHAVGPVAGVELREARAEARVLEPGEDAVAHVLVARHAAAQGLTGAQHPRPEHGVALVALEGADQVGEALGRILPVTVEQDHDVEAVLDGHAVARLLVAPVAQVLRVAHDGERQVGAELLVAQPHQIGGIAAGVVADQHLLDPRAEVLRDPVKDAGQRGSGVVRDDQDPDPGAFVGQGTSNRGRLDCP